MNFRLTLLLVAAISGTFYAGTARKSPKPYITLAAAPQAKSAPAKGPAVTFNKDIAPIIFENCTSCHRLGQVAPFSLLNYEDAKKRAQQIALVTQERIMPPWKADEGKEKFHDARQLTSWQIDLIRQWAAAGAPEGKASERPEAPQFTSGWKIGEPDVVFAPEAPYELEAEGNDIYRCFVIPTNYAEDRWVSAIEVRPGNARVVHHVIAYLNNNGAARQKDQADPGPGYTSFGGPGFPPSGTLGGWAPGNEPRLLPAGTGMLLPRGTDIVLQVHYHKSGKPEKDLTQLGLTFSKVPVDKRMRVMPILYLPLRIPPGEKNYMARAEATAPTDITVHGVMPHMHLLGREMTVTASLADSSRQKLVRVPDWDFNWQSTYVFKKPIALPAGSKVELEARYDNSLDNPSNPSNPPREVRWGEETTDEMCIAFLYYTADAEHLTRNQQTEGLVDGFGGAAFRANPQGVMRQLIEMFDKDKNGTLDSKERVELNEFVRKNN